uniref:hypothetical protein n=1 Tax=Halobacteriovorax sp. TaxID=2020862 RepID=UPI003563467E
IRKLNVKHLLLLSKEVKQSQIFKKFIIENDLNDELYILTDKKSLEMIERKKRDEIEKFKKKVVFLSNRSVDNSNLFNLKINNTWYLDRDFTNFILKHIPAKVATLPDFAKFDKILAREALKESFKKSIRSGNIRGPILNDSYNHFLCFTKDPSSISLFKFKKKLDYSFLNKVLNHNRTAIQEILEINIDDKKLWDLALDSWSYDEMPSGRLRRSLIGYVPRKLLSNNAFVLDVLNTDPVSIYFLPKDVSLKLKGTDIANFKDRARNQFISEIRNLKRPELVEYRLSAFKNDKEIAEIIIANENLSHYFYLFSEKVRFDRAISKNALSANIDNYPWVSSELRSMKDNILKYAVYSTRMYTPFLNNPFFKDRDFVIEYLALLSSTKSRRYTFRKTYIHKSLISDPGIKEYLQMYYP